MLDHDEIKFLFIKIEIDAGRIELVAGHSQLDFFIDSSSAFNLSTSGGWE